MRYVSLFSGIEAASAAWGPLGWEPVSFSEIDPFPSAVLAHRFPGVPNLGDITKIDWSKHGECVSADLVVGGSPCQSFSIAGTRTGLDGASGLMWEYVRAVRELRPRWVVWENVPGALSSSDGRDFGCLLGALDDLGYGLAWRVLDAQFFGVAQRRRRLFLVGSLGDQRASEVLFESESLRWDHPSSRAKRQALAGPAQVRTGGAGDGGGRLTRGGHRNGRGGDGRTVALNFNPTDSRLKYAEEDVSQTLTARMGTGGNQVPLVQDGAVLAFAQNQRGEVRDMKDLSGALAARPGVKQQTYVCRPDTYCLHNSSSGPDVDEDVSGTLRASDVNHPKARSMALGEELSPTLKTDHNPAVLCATDPGSYVFSGQNSAKAGLSLDADTSPTLSTTKQPTVSTRNLVRRLTPTECERLQGFKDGWTDVPYRGAEHAPDSPRYKALGNSMAVPVMRWIGQRIQHVEEVPHDVD